MDASDSASGSTSGLVLPLAASRNGRTPGKAHKSTKTAVRRSYISPAVKTPFHARMEKQKERDAMRAVESEMKGEKEQERVEKVTKIKARREREAEKIRMEQLAAKMSAKKLQRMKKRQGRSKKINQ